MMPKLVWLTFCALLYAHAAQAGSGWTRVASDHFVFVGNASERDIRSIAQHLEQFRSVVSQVLPAPAVASTVPTIVYVFQNDSSLTPYKPAYHGKPVVLAGFFSGWTDRNLIAINAAAEQTALRVVFHEYAHFLVQNTSGRLPPWANEGFAGFYETFEERSGRAAFIGEPNNAYVALLKTGAFTPLADLLAVDYSSPDYNEGSWRDTVDRRGLFYAESWALVHYLQLGSPARRSQLAQYLARLHDGEDPQQTFAATFGDLSTLERELRAYVRRFRFPAIQVDVTGKRGVAAVSGGEALDDPTATTYLADLLARTGHVDEARTRLQKLLDATPNASAAAETLGVLELNDGHPDRALPWLERAAADRSNAGAQVLWGRAVIDRYESASRDGSDPGSSIDAVRAALARAAELRPRDAETLAAFGRAESIAGEDTARALALLDSAVALAPGREEYRLMLAEELVRQREFARAADLLGPLASSARTPGIRDAAKRVLAHAEARAAELARAGAALSATSPDPVPDRTPGPSFRIPRPDETRAVGTLTAIDCEGTRIVMHVETDAESLRLAAAGIEAVQFISYQQAASEKSLVCGRSNPPTRVFATYVESDAATQATGIDGRAIAIELLPEGYELR